MKIPKKNLKRILMIATGGTIASKRSDEGLKPLITSKNSLVSYRMSKSSAK